jgi:hypothetical protein
MHYLLEIDKKIEKNKIFCVLSKILSFKFNYEIFLMIIIIYLCLKLISSSVKLYFFGKEIVTLIFKVIDFLTIQ